MLFGKVFQAPGEALFKAKVTLFFLFGAHFSRPESFKRRGKKTIHEEKISHNINSCFRSPKNYETRRQYRYRGEHWYRKTGSDLYIVQTQGRASDVDKLE